MAKYLVTGGAGFIGSHIAERLLKDGHEVTILDDLSTGSRDNIDLLSGDLEFIEGSLCDSAAVAQAVDGVEVVFHQAALASVPRSVAAPLDTHDACVTGTVKLLDAARRSGVRRVVYAASSSAYGDQPFSSKRETDAAMPLSPYAAAKLAAEYYCHAFWCSYQLETVSIRYFNVFGPRQDPASEYSAVIPRFVSLMIEGKQPTIFGDGTQSRDFTHVDNVVAGNLAAAEAKDAPGKTLNVACGRQTTLLELVDGINVALGTSIEPIFEPPRVGDVHESLADISLARNLLGYAPQVDFDEGLELSIEYYKSLVLG